MWGRLASCAAGGNRCSAISRILFNYTRERLIVNSRALPRPEPSISRNAEQRSALHHRAPAFGERRHAEFDAARDGVAVPRRECPAAIFLPQGDPGKIGALPLIAE